MRFNKEMDGSQYATRARALNVQEQCVKTLSTPPITLGDRITIPHGGQLRLGRAVS